MKKYIFVAICVLSAFGSFAHAEGSLVPSKTVAAVAVGSAVALYVAGYQEGLSLVGPAAITGAVVLGYGLLAQNAMAGNAYAACAFAGATGLAAAGVTLVGGVAVLLNLAAGAFDAPRQQ